ncbi:MAG TPA: hypothetical protein VKC66_23465 [Xanthobacteraceae bacterium]|nr:hypothetical protein [Xanthobacteraceae bacterium]
MVMIGGHAGETQHHSDTERAMPLSDEDRTEIEAIIRKELVERERKAGMRWRTPLLVGGIVIPVALAYLVLKYGPPATLLDQADFGMVALGIGWLAIFATRVVIVVIGLAGRIFFSQRNISTGLGRQ